LWEKILSDKRNSWSKLDFKEKQNLIAEAEKKLLEKAGK